MGHLRKLGPKKWKIIIDLGRDENGKRKRKYKTVNVPHPEAKRIMQRMELELRNKPELEDEIKLKQHLRDWIDHYKSNIKPLTEESYRNQIEAYLIPHLGEIKLKDLTTKIIDDYYKAMLNHGKKRNNEGLSKRTVKYHHTILKKALDKAKDWDRLEENPAAEADPPKYNPYKNRDINPYELLEIIDNVDNYIYRCFYKFNLMTGLRRGEILALMWRSVDWNRKLISVRQSLQKIKDQYVMQDMTKNNNSYTIPIGNKVIKLLEEIKAKQEKDKKRIGKDAYKDNGFIFAYEDGSFIPEDTIYKVFKKAAKNLEYDYTLHDLRHGFSTIQITSGVHTKTLQGLLNHKSEEVTSRIYSHILQKQKTEAADNIDNFF